MNKKQLVATELFQHCLNRNHFTFHNDLVKEISQKYKFGNPFDATKLDDTSKLPLVMKEHDYFLIHIGGGYHQFVKGIEYGFHQFEPIPAANKFRWRYRQSILNEFDTSESNILSVVNNQKIIHHFLFGREDTAVNVYFPRRTKMSFKYRIGNTHIVAKNLQMEIDMTMEAAGNVTVLESKNKFPPDFAVYQLYHPFLYYHTLKETNELNIKQINGCYLLRHHVDGTTVLRLFLYTFTDPYQMDSIKLLKNAEYRLVQS